MYYEHFGLTQPPFKITPNTAFFFPGGNRGPILDALVYAITQGEGIVKVTGEVGSGKTMLCRMLEASLPDTVETIYLANPSVEPGEILHAVLGVILKGGWVRPKCSKYTGRYLNRAVRKKLSMTSGGLFIRTDLIGLHTAI